jgi:peptidoglycan hydrolase-like protein with peptidoglycan-binding domain
MKPEEMPVLKFGSSGPDVIVLQKMLQSSGHFDGEALGNFKGKTDSAVRYFQMTHINKDGRFLDVDGVVGPETWWALMHPDGSAQKSGIKPEPPTVKKGQRSTAVERRMKLLAWALKEYKKGVKEVPSGSNWSPRIKEYLGHVGIDYPAPWCQAFTSSGHIETFNYYPGIITGGVWKAWNDARRKGTAIKNDGSYKPRPGDRAFQLHGDGTGHTFYVVKASKDFKYVNTIEGNAGNRVKAGLRNTATIDGYVNDFGDAGEDYAFATGSLDGDAKIESDR